MHLQYLARAQQLDSIEVELEQLTDTAASRLRSRPDRPNDEDHTDPAPKRRRVEGKSDLG
jgi:hypothetical protein